MEFIIQGVSEKWLQFDKEERGVEFLGKYLTKTYIYTYRRIAKTPRHLLYLEFEYNSRKIAKDILCYLIKLEYISRKFD